MSKQVEISLDVPFLGLDGNPIKERNGEVVMLGPALGEMLFGGQHPDPLKVDGWARKLYDGQPLVLDQSDVRKLCDAVNGLSTTSGFKAAVLSAIRDAENAAK